jgi:multiple sugar transport system permease protein
MESRVSSLDRYNRRLFFGAALLVAVLLGLAAWLPFRYAGERASDRLKLLLAAWSDRLYSENKQFADGAAEIKSITVGRQSFQLTGREKPVPIILASVEESAATAGRWAGDGLPGFDLESYIVSGSLPLRAVGDLVLIDGRPYVMSLRPAKVGGEERPYVLTLGPSLAGEFTELHGDDWSLAYLSGGQVLFSTLPQLRAGEPWDNRQLTQLIDEVTRTEVSQTAHPDVLGGRPAVLSAYKDFDQWDVVGTFILSRKSAFSFESPWYVALAVACVAFAVAAFAIICYRRLPREGKKAVAGGAARVATVSAILLSAATLLLMAGLFSGEAGSAAERSFSTLVAADRVTVEEANSFFNSLDVLAFAALITGAVAVSLLFLGAVRRFQHLTAMRQAVAAAGFIAPAAVHVAVFTFGPVLFALYLSFQKWEILNPIKEFVGLSNYLELFKDPLFWMSLVNTLVYSLHVPVTMAIALALALALHEKVRGVTLLRTLFFLPYITSFVAISTVWQWLYNPEFGMLNYLLSLFGLGSVNWLSDPATAMISVMVLSVWIQLGYQMVIFIAGLQGIPNHLYEAAIIDGAGPWVRFRRITLPLLRPTIFFILVTSIINSFQVFTYVYVMTQGGPLHSTEVLVYHIYKNAWEYYRMGYASAVSWVLFVMIMAVTLIQFAYFRKRIEAVRM